MVELLGIAGWWQGLTSHVETLSAQCQRGIAIGNALDFREQNAFDLSLELQPELSLTALIGERAIGGHALRYLGKGLEAHKTADAMGTDDDSQADPRSLHDRIRSAAQASAEASPSAASAEASALSAAAASSASRRRSSASRRRSCAFALGRCFLVCSRRSRGGINSASAKKRATRSLGTAPWLSQYCARSFLMTRRSAWSRGSMGL